VQEPAELQVHGIDIDSKYLEIKSNFHLLNRTRKNIRKSKELHKK
jgi:hypothetical protein